jgi:hypothetical protein
LHDWADVWSNHPATSLARGGAADTVDIEGGLPGIVVDAIKKELEQVRGLLRGSGRLGQMLRLELLDRVGLISVARTLTWVLDMTGSVPSPWWQVLSAEHADTVRLLKLRDGS